MNKHAHKLPELEVGERVFVQNQHGPHPNKWDRSGIVLESLGHHQYNIKIDGTGRITKRNRQFLRKYTLPETEIRVPTIDTNAPSLFNNVPIAAKAIPDLGGGGQNQICLLPL